MNKLIRKIATAAMALTLIAGVFTGCGTTAATNNTTAAPAATQYTLSADISLKSQNNGTLPETGNIGDIAYEFLNSDNFGYKFKEKGYIIDSLEEPDSPFFIVITSGPETAAGATIKIVDIGEENGTVKIVVEENAAKGEDFDDVYSPFCVVKFDRLPGSLEIRNTNGEVFDMI